MKEIIEVFHDVWAYIKATRNIYISFLIAFFLFMSMVVVMTEGSAIMPFIYTIF